MLKEEELYKLWNKFIQSKDRKEIENELKDFRLKCKEICDTFTSYIPNYKGVYNLEEVNIIKPKSNIHKFLSILKFEEKTKYERFTEKKDILNAKEFFDFEGKEILEIFCMLSDLKDYSSFLSHLILRIYDEKDEEKKKEMLHAMM